MLNYGRIDPLFSCGGLDMKTVDLAGISVAVFGLNSRAMNALRLINKGFRADVYPFTPRHALTYLIKKTYGGMLN